jgi:hypothetical protein
MQAFKMAVSRTVETWTCNQPGCGHEFAVLMVARPNREFLDEYPDIPEACWSEWSNKAAQAPYCPHCGTILTPNDEAHRGARQGASGGADGSAAT